MFLNSATKGTRLLTEDREVLAGLEGFRALFQAITQRQALSDCFAQGGRVRARHRAPARSGRLIRPAVC